MYCVKGESEKTLHGSERGCWRGCIHPRSAGFRIGMGRHLNCGGDFGAERRCFGELSKKQDGDMDNLKVGDSRRCRMPVGALMSGF